MTIHVNIGEAKTRLSELVAASLRGEDVVLQKAGRPVARIVPVDAAAASERTARGARRAAAIGMFKDALAGADLDASALKRERNALAREARALGPDI